MIIITASLTPSAGKQNSIVCIWFVGEVCDSFGSFLVALFLASFSLLIDCPQPIPESEMRLFVCLFVYQPRDVKTEPRVLADAFTTTCHQVASYDEPGRTRFPLRTCRPRRVSKASRVQDEQTDG